MRFIRRLMEIKELQLDFEVMRTKILQEILKELQGRKRKNGNKKL